MRGNCGRWGFLVTFVLLLCQIERLKLCIGKWRAKCLKKPESGVKLEDHRRTNKVYKVAELVAPTDYYVAAVVEFEPTYVANNGSSTLKINTNKYIEYIKEAKQQGADIIVFPEDGLTSIHMPDKSRMDSWSTAIPSALEDYVPCTGNRNGVSETLKNLSCAAKANSIYVVVNIAEKESCGHGNGYGECSFTGTRYHNTNVVFDRSGKIIARYRKVNLYMESSTFDTVEHPEIVTFDTDFGVKFGTFICFDILFPFPALNLTRIQGVSNIVYSTAWFSEIPFLTAVQTQYAWAFAENVNLLAAGYHQPNIGSAGSGIYLGRRGIVNATFSSHPDHRLLISRVPKTTVSNNSKMEQTNKEVPLNEPLSIQQVRLMRDNITTYESVPLNKSMNQTICHRAFCCDFDVRTTLADSRTNYRAVVYNGVRWYGTEVKSGIRVCALIQCSNDSIATCGSAGRSNTTFADLKITARFDDYSKIMAMPSVLNSSLLPFEHWTQTEHTDKNRTTLTLALNQTTKDLVTFGVYVRDFSRDQWINGLPTNTAPSIIALLFLTILISFLR